MEQFVSMQRTDLAGDRPLNLALFQALCTTEWRHIRSGTLCDRGPGRQLSPGQSRKSKTAGSTQMIRSHSSHQSLIIQFK